MIRQGEQGFSNKADVWAVGCIFYELLVGKRPFVDDWSVSKYAESDKPISIPEEAIERFGADWHKSLSRFLGELLSVNPRTRFSVAQAMSHCAFHYEFGFIDHATVYESYRRRGCAYQEFPRDGTLWYAGAYGSTYICFALPQGNLVVLNALNPGSNSVLTTRDRVDAFRTPGLQNIWKRRSTGCHLLAIHPRDGWQDWVQLCELSEISPGVFAEEMKPIIRWSRDVKPAAIALSYDGDLLAWATMTGRVHFQSLNPDVAIAEPVSGWRHGIQQKLGFNRRGDCLYSSSFMVRKLTFAVWRRWDHASYFEKETTFPYWISGNVDLFHPFLYRVLFCPDEQTLQVIDFTVDGYTKLEGEIKFNSPIVSVTYSPCGRYIVTSHRHLDEVCIIDATTMQRLRTIPDIGGGPVWFCDEKNELCFVLPEFSTRLYLLNFKAERRRLGF